MKKYYVVHGDFSNVYELFWADSPEMETLLPENAERITRADAIKLCVRENQRRRNDRNFSGYADNTIHPAGTTAFELRCTDRCILHGYIWETKK